MHIPEAGRGRALTRAWLASDADVLTYMDIDLSTDLAAFPKLVSAVAEGGYEVAAGSRLSAESETTRSLKREVLSRGFVFIINTIMGTKLRDTQCGFKAIRRECAQKLLPLVQDTGWFWDTELLLTRREGRLGRNLRAGALAGGHGQPGEDRLDGFAGPRGAVPHAAVRLVEGAQGARPETHQGWV